MKYFLNLLIFLFFVNINTSFAQKINSKFPQDYEEVSIELLNEEYWFTHYDNKNIVLEKQCEQIIVSELTYKKTEKLWIVESSFGGLLGVDSGQWIGGLYHIAGYGVPNLIKKMNVNHLHITNDDRVLFFDINYGNGKSTLNEIYQNEDTADLEIEKILNFDDLPTMIYYDKDGSFYVLGKKNIYRYIDRNLVPILGINIWKDIEPKSVVQDSKNCLIVGIRGGILEIDINNKSLKLFVKKK